MSLLSFGSCQTKTAVMTLFWSKLFYKCTVMTLFRHNIQPKCATITLFPHMPFFRHQRVLVVQHFIKLGPFFTVISSRLKHYEQHFKIRLSNSSPHSEQNELQIKNTVPENSVGSNLFSCLRKLEPMERYETSVAHT